ncbi:MAG: methionine aminotransferase [Flavobacteriaceae bacterium]|nr:methionine aminotransferase [Flavobacteriaceae bacterium]
MPIESKLPQVGTTIFTVMGQMAHEHGAVNLSQGFPNFEVAPQLLQLVDQAQKEGFNQYAPMQGIYSLRERIAEKMEVLYGADYDPATEVTVTAGATQALFTAISAFVHPGNEVIVFKPAYDSYEPAIELYGGVCVPLQLVGKEYRIDWDAFKQVLGPKTRMIIINTPHNPSGSILTSSDLETLQRLLRDTDVLVLSDEVYEHIVFDGQSHESMAKYNDLRARSLICASFGKTFHVTGWKMGYCLAPKALMQEFQKVHQYNVFCVNHPVQRALATYFKTPEHYLGLSAFYQEKRDYFLQAIEGSRFRFTPAQGTYFQLLEYSAVTDEGDVAFAERLVKEHGLASIPVSVFNVNGLDLKQLRFCFAKTQATLDRAAEILCAI